MSPLLRMLSLVPPTLLATWLFDRSCLAQSEPAPERSDAPGHGPITVGLGLGVSAMNEHGPFGFNDGVGTIANAGPAWGLLVGLDVLPWLTVEGRYFGMYDSTRASVSPGGAAGFLATGAAAVVRLTAPLPFVHPYVFGGVGYYAIGFVGSSNSQLHSSSQAGLPMGLGVDVPLTNRLSVAAEATYHFQIQEDYSPVTANGIDGGDLSTFTAVLRARL